MNPTRTLSTAAAFFFKHAGWSHAIGEDPAEGRTRCAERLAECEATASADGVSFQWEIDPDIDSSEFSDERPSWYLWQCVAHTPSGDVVDSIGGVDLGRNGHPDSDPYRRVIEAELAQGYVARKETARTLAAQRKGA